MLCGCDAARCWLPGKEGRRMMTRAVAIIHDNGEEVMVELPREQDLLDEIHELQRDGDIAIGKWRARHASVSSALMVVALCGIIGWVTAIYLAAIVWGW
jgi:hypothetical protein